MDLEGFEPSTSRLGIDNPRPAARSREGRTIRSTRMFFGALPTELQAQCGTQNRPSTRSSLGTTDAAARTEQGSRVPSARARAPPADDESWVLQLLTSPGPSLVKKLSPQSPRHRRVPPRARENRTPHLALGAGGAMVRSIDWTLVRYAHLASPVPASSSLVHPVSTLLRMSPSTPTAPPYISDARSRA